MILIVADTGPINYLIENGQIELLSRLAHRVVLPHLVVAELQHPAAPELVRRWVAAPPAWVEIRTATQLIAEQGISDTDREAIALALELSASVLLMDDQQARRCAARLGVATMGTIGILEVAAGRDLVMLSEVLAKLRETSCFVTDEIIEAALQRDAERREG